MDRQEVGHCFCEVQQHAAYVCQQQPWCSSSRGLAPAQTHDLT